jgi:hypothetical protein
VAAQHERGRHPFLARRFEDEAGYRRRVEVAERQGVPPSQLEGREPATETRYVYDRRGRLVRSITRSEPRYTDQDRAELIALALYREGLCPIHHGPRSECESRDGQPPPSFRASSSYCHAQVELIEAQSVNSDDRARRYAPAKLWTVKRR